MSSSTLAQTYDFSSFTHEAYARLLKKAKARYAFRSYTDFDPNEAFVLWRHDVDASMHDAVTLARIEAEAGVKATYLLLPGCEHYNLFEPAIINCMREIRALGHAFGLHFHVTPEASASQEAFVDALGAQKTMLEAYCERPIDVFSYHNPNTIALSLDAERYSGMVNTYSRYFRDEVAYCSDSNGIWRHASLDATLDAGHARLQVLTHPEWWTELPMSPRERIFRCIHGRARHTLRYYNHALHANHRPNVTELDAIFLQLEHSLGEAALSIEMLWLGGDHGLAFIALWREIESRGMVTDATSVSWRDVCMQLIRGEHPTVSLMEAMHYAAGRLA